MLKKAFLYCIFAGLLAISFVACDTSSQGSGLPSTPTPYNTPSSITLPQLHLGTHATIVYFTTLQTPSSSVSGIITRYDPSTGKETKVSEIASTTIEEAQLSRDGQWILFVDFHIDHDELRIVRLDGQNMQTVFIAPPYAGISSVQWSPDQQSIAFDEIPPQAGPVITYLLNIKQNSLQAELISPDAAGALYYTPRKWLDNTRLAMVGITSKYDPSRNIYLLDTHKGARQKPSDLSQIYTGTLKCGDFDLSDDASQLFVDTCTYASGTQNTGSSMITAYQLQAGTSHTIFQSSTQAITQVRFMAPHTLLLLSRGEFWTLSTDGTALTNVLSSTDRFKGQTFNAFTQYGWSNVSRDGNLFAMPSIEMGVDTHSSSLAYGRFGDSTLHTIASAFVGMLSPNSDVSLVGWTTF